MESSWCKSSPVKAVAGRPEASVAVRWATGGREAYTARKRAARIELRNRPVVAKADAVVVAEGSTLITVTRGGQGSPESVARGTLSKGFPVNLGELAISPEMGSVLPNPKEPGLRGMRAAPREANKPSTRETCRQGQPEAAATGERAGLRPHSTVEGGEPQGSRKGRPRYPLEGRGKQVDVSIGNRIHGTQNSETYIQWNSVD